MPPVIDRRNSISQDCIGGRVIKVNAKEDQGFYSEYYLFIPDSLKTSGRTFLLVEPNNAGVVDDDHRTHVDAAYDIIRFGQANGIAKDLGVPLLVPCFGRPETNWEQYTHALDRDTMLITDGPLERNRPTAACHDWGRR